MILVDTSVWIDHFRRRDERLVRLLEQSAVLTHPFVIGEIALGSLEQREIVLRWLSGLPPAIVASDAEALDLIEGEALAATGVGYLDAHLLASSRLTLGARLWSRDRRLANAAKQLSVAFEPVD
jgi:hypothetical protein